MWQRRMKLERFVAVMEIVRNNASGLKDRANAGPHGYRQITALVESGRTRIADFYADLEARLGEEPITAGEQFSVADVTSVVAVDFAPGALSL